MRSRELVYQPCSVLCCQGSPHTAACTAVRSSHAAVRAGQLHGQAGDVLPSLLGSADAVLQVGWHNAKGELVSEHTIRLARDSTVQQVLDEVKQVVNADPQAELRMLEILQNRISKVSVSSHWLPVFATGMESCTRCEHATAASSN